jgi:hypothetical protein
MNEEHRERHKELDKALDKLEEQYNEWKKWEGKVIHIRIDDVEGPYTDMNYFRVNAELLEGPEPEKRIDFDVDAE